MKKTKISMKFLFLALLFILAGSIISIQAQSKDPDNPTRMTSNQVSGLINEDTIGSTYYYSFWAEAGEVSVKLRVTSDPSKSGGSTLKFVSFTLLDANDRNLGTKSVSTSYGAALDSQTATTLIDSSSKKKVKIAINIAEGFNKGTGNWKIIVDGAVAFD